MAKEIFRIIIAAIVLLGLVHFVSWLSPIVGELITAVVLAFGILIFLLIYGWQRWWTLS